MPSHFSHGTCYFCLGWLDRRGDTCKKCLRESLAAKAKHDAEVAKRWPETLRLIREQEQRWIEEARRKVWEAA